MEAMIHRPWRLYFLALIVSYHVAQTSLAAVVDRYDVLVYGANAAGVRQGLLCLTRFTVIARLTGLHLGCCSRNSVRRRKIFCQSR